MQCVEILPIARSAPSCLLMWSSQCGGFGICAALPCRTSPLVADRLGPACWVCSTYHVIHTQKICCTAIVAFRVIMSRSITAVPKDVLIPRRTSLVLCSFGHTHDDVKVHHVQGASVGT